MPSRRKQNHLNHHPHNRCSSTLTLNGDTPNGAAAKYSLNHPPLTLNGDASASAAEKSPKSPTSECLTQTGLTGSDGNGRETLFSTTPPSNISEALTLARTDGDDAFAENSWYGDPLQSTGVVGPGNRETLIPAAGDVSFRHGHSADAKGPHRNGKTAAQEKIDNLKLLNQTLLKQVSSSRSARAELDAKIKALQGELEESNARADVLLMEKNWLENHKAQFELDLASSRKESAELGLEKEGLIAEKQALLASKHRLERNLSESEGKLKETREKLEESVRVLTLAEEKAQSLNSELERACSKGHSFYEEINTLQMLNSDIQRDMKDLQLKKISLDNELSTLHDACAAAKRQVVEANQAIEALQAELCARSLEREGFQMQLKEAWQQIASLEAQQEARTARDINLQRRVQHLENELVRVLVEHEDTSCILNQETEARSSLKSLLDTSEGKTKRLKAELHTMSSSMAKLRTDTDGYQKQILLLEAQVTSLANGKAKLEKTNASLEEKLRELNSRSAKASLEAEDEREKLQAVLSKLKHDLVVAKADASGGGKIVCQLKSELKKLDLRLKSRAKLTDVSWPLAALSSSSLVALGILVFCKRFK